MLTDMDAANAVEGLGDNMRKEHPNRQPSSDFRQLSVLLLLACLQLVAASGAWGTPQPAHRLSIPPLPQSPAGLAPRALDFGTPPWHLLSVPDEPDNIDPATVLSTVASDFTLAYAYDACDPVAPWRVYDPTDIAGSDLNAIDHRIGFWFKGSDPDPLAVSGVEPAETSIPLCAGWNLIGYPLAQDRPVLSALSSIAGKFLRVYGFDPTDEVEPWRVFDVDVPDWVNTLRVMERGKGYWIYATEDTTLAMRNIGPPPDVEIILPEYGTAVTTLTDVVGTVESDLLESWEVAHRLDGQGGEFTVFATGDTPKMAEVLGTLDPTLLLNGLYEIQLTATDFQGRSTATSTLVSIEGRFKIGHVQLDFLDLELDFAHLPLMVFRSYDSRNKEQGDFGIGWRLSMSDVLVQENAVPGDDWRGTVEGTATTPIYCIESSLPRIVAITFPSGELFRYRMTIEPRCQLFIPPQVVTISYSPLSGPQAAGLAPLGVRPTEFLVIGSFPGPIQLFDLDTALPFNPGAYRMTSRNGVILDIDEEQGLTRIEEPNGQTVTFSPGGIVHSNGPSAQFTRDTEGRITEITGSAGEVLTYRYDAAGDLESFTDQENDTYGFEYVGDHFLHEIIEPDGTRILAAEYDDDGRLIAACGDTDACHRVSHDLDGKVETIVDATGRKTVIHYNDIGNVLRVENDEGVVRRFEYDDRGRQIKQFDALGRLTELVYEGNDIVTAIKPHEPGDDPADFTTHFDYDSGGRLTSVSYPSGGSIHWDYDPRGNLMAFRDQSGPLLTMVRDPAGLVLSETDSFGLTTYDDYDTFDNPRRIEDVTGVTLIDYDGAGRTTRHVDPALTWDIDYSTPREVVIRTPGDDDQTYGFDAAGAIGSWKLGERTVFDQSRSLGGLDQTLATGEHQVGLTFDPANRLTAITSPGETLLSEYDTVGRLKKETSSLGAATEYVFDAAGQMREIREGDDVWTFDYRPSGELISTSNPRGANWTFAYTPTSRSITSDPLGRRLVDTLSPQGLVLERLYPDEKKRSWTYALSSPLVDAEEFPSTITDESGRVRSYGYDSLMNLTSASDLAGELYTYTYDGDLLRDLTDPTGRILKQSFDDRERLRFITREDDEVEELVYLPDSFDVHEQVFPSGRKVTFLRDDDGNVTSRSSSDGEVEEFTWFDFRSRDTATNAAGTTRYGYGPVSDRLEQITLPDGGTVVYGYDPDGLVTSIETSPGGSNATYRTVYGYDAVDNLTSILDPLGGLTLLTYDLADRLETRTLPNGVVTTWEHDLRDRIRKVTHRDPSGTVIASVETIRKPSGEPERILYEDASAVELDYDGALRLEEERHLAPDGSLVEVIAYSYDKAGNRLTKSDGGGSDVYGYGAGHRLTSVTRGTSVRQLTTDVDGRVTGIDEAGSSRVLTYDFMDRLVAVSDDGTEVARHTYDAEGRRIASHTAAGERRFVVAPAEASGLEQPHLATDENGALIAGWVWAGGAPLLRFGPDGPVYYLNDAIGSVVGLTDSGGQAVARWSYDGFGNVRSASGPAATTPPAAGFEILFQGQVQDPTTGFYHLRMRWYDPSTGRFVSRDPAGVQIDLPEYSHPYVFAVNNPFLFQDPQGLFSISEVNVMAAIQSNLGRMQAAFARQIFRQVVQEARQEAVSLLLSGVLSAIGLESFADIALDATGINRGKIGNYFEDVLSRLMCDVSPPPISGRLWFEPWMTANGDPQTNGVNCESLGTFNPARGRRRGAPWSCPDILLLLSSRKTPMGLRRPGRGQTIFPGDFKLRVKTALNSWRRKQRRQFNSIRNHAVRYGFRIATLWSFLEGRDGRRGACESASKMFKREHPHVTLIGVTITGGICTPLNRGGRRRR